MNYYLLLYKTRRKGLLISGSFMSKNYMEKSDEQEIINLTLKTYTLKKEYSKQRKSLCTPKETSVSG